MDDDCESSIASVLTWPGISHSDSNISYGLSLRGFIEAWSRIATVIHFNEGVNKSIIPSKFPTSQTVFGAIAFLLRYMDNSLGKQKLNKFNKRGGVCVRKFVYK